MATTGYLLGEKTAGELRRRLAEPPNPLHDGPRSFTAPPKLMAWVRVTGAVSAGWHPGVVTTPTNAGTWEDFTGAVEVAPPPGGRLRTSGRYLCQRTGDKADGTPRFVAATELREVTITLPSKASIESAIAAAVNAAFDGLAFTGSVTLTCNPNGTATASVSLTRSGGGSPGTVTVATTDVKLEGCRLVVV